jgi:hypothetical protein
MANFTTASELKVGQRIEDGDKSQFGQYTEQIVTSITITKNGCYDIRYSAVFVQPNGERKFQEDIKLGKKGKKGTAIIVLF